MTLIKKSYLSSFVLSVLLISQHAYAVTFTDVNASSPYYKAIEDLVSKGIIKGNPDGTYQPERNLNRAELLVLLYRATGTTAQPLNSSCFPDVIEGSWYAKTVCDAFEAKYVAGYSDGLFKPDNPVSRVEAVKMIVEVIGLPFTDRFDALLEYDYQDIDTAEWYMPYLATAFAWGMLPLGNAPTDLFGPASLLSRGEAAMYIYRALQVTLNPFVDDVTLTPQKDVDEPTEVQQEVQEFTPKINVKTEDIPFTDSSRTSTQAVKIYRFSVDAPTMIYAEVATDADEKLICRLYLLNENGFSLEYYLGYVENKRCHIRSNLRPGEYQLQVDAEKHGSIAYDLSVNEVTETDGNDGFIDAVLLKLNIVKASALQPQDLSDWYTFSVSGDEKQRLTVNVSSSKSVSCLIYPMEDVDIFGFKGPVCNSSYDYPSGTYVVNIRRTAELYQLQDYSIILQN